MVHKEIPGSFVLKPTRLFRIPIATNKLLHLCLETLPFSSRLHPSLLVAAYLPILHYSITRTLSMQVL